MKKPAFVFVSSILLTPIFACDADTPDPEVDERFGSLFLPYDYTRAANPIEGQGGDLKLIQYVANGVSQDPASFTFIHVGQPAACNGTDCDALVSWGCFANAFGQDQADQEASLDEFLADSQARFNINLADPAKFLLLPYEARSDVGIRAVAISGLRVPAEGFAVNDCGWQAVGIDGQSPNVNKGAYLVEAEDAFGNPVPITINYRLREFVIQTVSGNGNPMAFLRYDIVADRGFGEGIAQIVTASECDGTIDPTFGICIGTTSHNIRNTMTFSDRGGL